jgi:hypothetical protein
MSNKGSNGNRGNTSYGSRTNRERILCQPICVKSGTHKDVRKNTKLMKMVETRIKIDNSEIHGKGVFAISDIPVGQIAWYRGPIYDNCHLNATHRDGTYMMIFGKAKTIDGMGASHWTKYMNDAHNTERTCNVQIGAKASIHSTRVILAGEELLLSYGQGYWPCSSSASTT